jgi:S-formylglutathione hydrolase FrmB
MVRTRTTWRAGASAALLSTIAILAFAPAPASAADPMCQLDPTPPEETDRIKPRELDGQPFNVLLPVGYEGSDRRYPVLYLFHPRGYSENSWLARTDLETFTEKLNPGQAAIVVMPAAGPDDWHLDYFDRSQLWETYHLKRLIPHVDASFRTLPDRAQRAVAGFSLGGHGAMHYAVRRPDLFAASGCFSGLVHLTYPEAAYTPGEVDDRSGAGSPEPPRGPSPEPAYDPPSPSCGGGDDALGNRISDAWSWHNHNPTDLTPNLRPLSLYVSAGNGVPCVPGEAEDVPPPLLASTEPGIRDMAERFSAALTAEGIGHRFDRFECGLHSFPTAQRGLHAFWDQMVDAFGTPPPNRFDFRSMDSDFSLWAWTFRADARRAPEFLEVRGASPEGFDLIGSGTATVVTAPMFKPRRPVRVTGALPKKARPDASGRITVAVDLGSPATEPQFALGEQDRQLVKRRVRFNPFGR